MVLLVTFTVSMQNVLSKKVSQLLGENVCKYDNAILLNGLQMLLFLQLYPTRLKFVCLYCCMTVR